MQHEIPISALPDILYATKVTSKKDTNALKVYVRHDDLQGLLTYLRLINFDIDDHNMGSTCKGVVLTLEIPEESVQTSSCKSIW